MAALWGVLHHFCSGAKELGVPFSAGLGNSSLPPLLGRKHHLQLSLWADGKREDPIKTCSRRGGEVGR